MLSKVVTEALLSVTKKHNYKTFAKSPHASLLHCIENILKHSAGKCRHSLTMAALRFTKSTGVRTDISLATSARRKDDTKTSLRFSSCTSLWYCKKLRLLGN